MPKKCPYCHFYVVLEKEELKDLLLEALVKEVALYKEAFKQKRLVSVYFGGGTPSLFGPARVSRVLDEIAKYTTVAEDCEITLEANPEQITFELMSNYKKASVNRLSIGVQSLIESELVSLGRTHDGKKAINAIFTSFEAGFSNISIDLMYETPDQSMKSWQETLSKIKNLPITHLSLYNLTIEPYTAFARKENELKKKMPSAEVGTEMYKMAIESLQEQGLIQYEISAFMKDSLYSKHNVGYWIGRPFLGLGPSAFSFFENKRFQNTKNLVRYAKALAENQSPVDFVDEIPFEERRRELLAINLRLKQGLDLSRFQEQFGLLDSSTEKSLLRLENLGLVETTSDGKVLHLTEKGLFFYDLCASELI